MTLPKLFAAAPSSYVIQALFKHYSSIIQAWSGMVDKSQSPSTFKHDSSMLGHKFSMRKTYYKTFIVTRTANTALSFNRETRFRQIYEKPNENVSYSG